MLERKLVQLAVQGLTQEDYPSFVKPNCLNARQRKHPCQVCVDVCPTGAMMRPAGQKADWDKCIVCNLCVTRCPSAAIAPSYQDFKRILRLFTTRRETRFIACEKSTSEADWAPWCLGVISWEILASLALSGKALVERAACEGCDRAQYLSGFDQALSLACQFLGEDFFTTRLSVLPVGEALPGLDLTRREAFRSLTRGAGAGMEALMPQDAKLGNNPLFPRRLLLRQVYQSAESANSPKAFTWPTPLVDSAVCWGCGICESACPHQALKVYLAPREDRRYLLHYPHRCTACGLCQAVCPDKAITGFGAGELPGHVKCFINPAVTTHCARCGGPVKPDQAGQACTRCLAGNLNRRR